ncbi:hypothetical protein AB870_15735 [Pandoraea faecigallinarum]|uniref:Translocation protein in type III secretion n=1 Tax=Pandoraea faecigallinarum TaxID=656179 RepID=A0A0H3WXM4_9BURK|nr:hypothetical protein AB870_15735 [Pandoraea faecigallinarum]
MRQTNGDALTADARIPLEDLLTGAGCMTFAQGDTEVRVGWIYAGGDGLVVTANVDDGVAGRIRLWCDARQWVDWLADDLPVPSWEALPAAWQASAASLTLAIGAGPVDGETPADSPLRSSWPKAESLAPERIALAWRMGIVLQRGGRRLALPYLDGATSWLRERCRRATRCDTPLDPKGYPMRRCAMAVGWTDLPASLCDNLREGGAVLLDVAADVSTGEYWLIDGLHAIAMRDGQPAERRTVSLEAARMEADDANGDATRCARLLAVIAEREIPIPWLIAWRAGQETPPETTARNTTAAGHITLWRDGAPWAGGRLLRFGDGRLAVQLEPTPGTSTDTPHAPEAISGRDRMGGHSASP